MGRKKTPKGSPSKSEPGGKGVNLLRAALTKSRSDRTISATVPPVSSGSSMVDITNVPQRPNISTLSSTSLDGTAKKRGRALAAFKQFQETTTPRTAMQEFMAAHDSSMQTPALFFEPKQPEALSGSDMGSFVQGQTSRINASNVISDISESVFGTDQEADVLSDASTGSEVFKVRDRKKHRNGGVTLEDVDPDRDITRPTNRSSNNTKDLSNYPFSDESANETQIRTRRERRKKKEYRAEEFDFSIALPGSKDSVPSIDVSEISVAESANETQIKTKRGARKKKEYRNEEFDFSIALPGSKESAPSNDVAEDSSPKVDHGLQTGSSEQSITLEKTTNTISNGTVDLREDDETPMPTRRRRVKKGEYNLAVGKEFNFTDEEETPVRKVRKTKGKAVVSGEDFSSISVDATATAKTPANDPLATGLTVDNTEVTDLREEIQRSDAQATREGENDINTNHELISGEEETPVRKVRSKKAKVVVDAVDFTSITLGQDQPESEQSVAQQTEPSTTVGTRINTTSNGTLNEFHEEEPSEQRNTMEETTNNGTQNLYEDDETPMPTRRRRRAKRGEYNLVVGKDFNFTDNKTPEMTLLDPGKEPRDASISKGVEGKLAISVKEQREIENLDSNNPDSNTDEEETSLRKVWKIKGKAAVSGEDSSSISVDATATAKTPANDPLATGLTVDNTEVTDLREETQRTDAEATREVDNDIDTNHELTSGEEETPVRKVRCKKVKAVVDAVDFTSITVGQEQTESEHSIVQQTQDQFTEYASPSMEVTDTEEETPILSRKIKGSKKINKVSVAIGDFTDISIQKQDGENEMNVNENENEPDSIRINRNEAAKEAMAPTSPFSPLINTPSPSARSYTNQIPARPNKDFREVVHGEESKEAKERDNSITRMSGNDSKESNISNGSPLANEHDANFGQDKNDVSQSFQGTAEKEKDCEGLSQDEKNILLSETRARRAARKSEVLGHFVRAPNLTNIVETTEIPSRPSSGLRTSSEMMGGQSSLETASRRTSSDPQLAKSSNMISIIEEKETNVETIESEDAVEVSSVPSNGEDVEIAKRRRRSVYQSGLPEQPIDSSMIMYGDQSKMFRPEVESTRLGNMTCSTDVSSPLQDTSQVGLGARPGRDTSTPAIERYKTSGATEKITKTNKTEESRMASSVHSGHTIAEQSQEKFVQSSTSSSERAPMKISQHLDEMASPRRSYLPSVPSKLTIPAALSKTQPHHPKRREQEGRLSKTTVNNTMMSVTSGTQYETPEVVRESRRSSKRLNLRQSLYKTRLEMDDIAEGGTQTTPKQENTQYMHQLSKDPRILSETGCQVTPSLERPELEKTKVIDGTELNKHKDLSTSIQSSEKRSKHQATRTCSLSSLEHPELEKTKVINGTELKEHEDHSTSIQDPEQRSKHQAARPCSASTLPYSPHIDMPSHSDRKKTDENRTDQIVAENSEIEEVVYHQYQQNASKELVNSFAEVDLEIFESEHDSSDTEDLNITGRKNPSPLLEQRAEADVVSDGDIETEELNSIINHQSAEEEINEDLNDDEVATATADLIEQDDALRNINTSHLVRPVLLPEPESRILPSSKERKEMRQATLVRYLGIQDCTARQGLETLLTPQHKKKKTVVGKKCKPVTEKPKTYFPLKNVKFDFNRFSRFKLKKDAEDILMDAHQDFMDMAMARLSDLAEERGADKIHLCDIRRLASECGFVKPSEEDPINRHFYSVIRDVCREDLARELIPCNMGNGTVYPPEDIWEDKGARKKISKPSSSRTSLGTTGSATSLGGRDGRGSTAKKADKVKRYKVAEDLDTSGPKRPRLTKNGGKGRKNRD